ncbi:hypothetical protein C8F01DRAFT_1079941 [Mycena amicta]|nr:hypothetical protein C8F01DRAFT_1079941 [Mycena amicta]
MAIPDAHITVRSGPTLLGDSSDRWCKRKYSTRQTACDSLPKLIDQPVQVAVGNGVRHSSAVWGLWKGTLLLTGSASAEAAAGKGTWRLTVTSSYTLADGKKKPWTTSESYDKPFPEETAAWVGGAVEVGTSGVPVVAQALSVRCLSAATFFNAMPDLSGPRSLSASFSRRIDLKSGEGVGTPSSDYFSSLNLVRRVTDGMPRLGLSLCRWLVGSEAHRDLQMAQAVHCRGAKAFPCTIGRRTGTGGTFQMEVEKYFGSAEIRPKVCGGGGLAMFLLRLITLQSNGKDGFQKNKLQPASVVPGVPFHGTVRRRNIIQQPWFEFAQVLTRALFGLGQNEIRNLFHNFDFLLSFMALVVWLRGAVRVFEILCPLFSDLLGQNEIRSIWLRTPHSFTTFDVAWQPPMVAWQEHWRYRCFVQDSDETPYLPLGATTDPDLFWTPHAKMPAARHERRETESADAETKPPKKGRALFCEVLPIPGFCKDDR